MSAELLHMAVERAAERAPERDAFRMPDVAITYAALSERAARLATVLRELGVRRGDRVGVFRQIGLESIVAVFGAMRAGAAYVPIDPTSPPARVAAILRDCGLRVVIADAGRSGALDEAARMETPLEAVVGVEGGVGALQTVGWSQVDTAPPAAQARLIGDDIAYIMYTSGSTGAPKGIVHTHASGSAYASAAAAFYDLRPGDRPANHAPLHFDISTFGMFAAPAAAATTILIPEVYKRFPAEMSALMERERVTHWYSAPFAFSQLLTGGVLDSRDLSALRYMMFGGDVLPTGDLAALMRALPQARFVNVFGPAEVNECANYVVPSPPDPDDSIPVGWMRAHCEGEILDENDDPVAPGQSGELMVRSPARMRGYWDRPDLTESRLRRRPVCRGIDDVFHRTGDIVRVDEDGLMFFLGRKDRQVKIRGFRIELEEIEAALVAHRAVGEAGVFVTGGGTGVAAAVSLRAEIDPEALRAHCADLLPPYAVPDAIHVLASFPRTGTGKIDRNALQSLHEPPGSTDEETPT